MARSEGREPAVHASVFTWRDISSSQFAHRILSRLLAEGDPFRFDSMGREEPLKRAFDPTEAEKMWAANSSSQPQVVYGDLLLERRAQPRTGFSSFWRRPAGVSLNSLGFWMNAEYLERPENVERFLSVFTDLAAMVGAGYGDAMPTAEFEAKIFEDEVLPDGRVGKRSITLKHEQGLKDLFWANFFGPPYVRLFGRNRLETCPNVELRWIGAESCLFLTCHSPNEWERPETQKAVEEAKDYLGRGAFYDRQVRRNPTLKPDWPSSA